MYHRTRRGSVPYVLPVVVILLILQVACLAFWVIGYGLTQNLKHGEEHYHENGQEEYHKAGKPDANRWVFSMGVLGSLLAMAVLFSVVCVRPSKFQFGLGLMLVVISIMHLIWFVLELMLMYHWVGVECKGGAMNVDERECRGHQLLWSTSFVFTLVLAVQLALGTALASANGGFGYVDESDRDLLGEPVA